MLPLFNEYINNNTINIIFEKPNAILTFVLHKELEESNIKPKISRKNINQK